jgi:tetratricopeptide (TPR) repeat protein
MVHFRRAIDLEPGYARAWSGIAICFGAMAVQSMVRPREGATEARDAAEQALTLDPLLAEAHLTMAGVQLFFEWNWASAERSLRSAMELSPSQSLGHGLFAHYAVARGWAEHAIAAARRALDLDPMSPVANVDLAWAYLLMREYPKALEQCSSILDMDINFPLARVYLAQVYQCMGKHELAVHEMEKAVPSAGDVAAPILAMLGYTYGVAGATGAAREVLHRLEELAMRRYVSPYDRAVVHTGLGENEEALRFLREALKERSPRMIWLNAEPVFDSLRDDRRIQAIVRCLKLQ